MNVLDRRIKRSENSWIENICQSLDHNGKQCNNKGQFTYKYHGEPEIYSDNVFWVKVRLCKKHKEIVPE